MRLTKAFANHGLSRAGHPRGERLASPLGPFSRSVPSSAVAPWTARWERRRRSSRSAERPCRGRRPRRASCCPSACRGRWARPDGAGTRKRSSGSRSASTSRSCGRGTARTGSARRGRCATHCRRGPAACRLEAQRPVDGAVDLLEIGGVVVALAGTVVPSGTRHRHRLGSFTLRAADAVLPGRGDEVAHDAVPRSVRLEARAQPVAERHAIDERGPWSRGP
jgi:hypothetical protein